jgi:hypothetical protein
MFMTPSGGRLEIEFYLRSPSRANQPKKDNTVAKKGKGGLAAVTP